MARRLLSGTRLLTFTGPGGSGKTRLALRVARDATGGFADGAWWVEVAPLSGPEAVPRAVALALGVREAPGRALPELVVGRLREAEALLVLDNCEHLVEACARLAAGLLRACPELKILATSREVLGVAGETLFAVPPLSEADAGTLFAERAVAASAVFAPGVEAVPEVERLCERLDRMPLAIELAAARTRVLSAGQILSRLDDSFGLLTGGDRTGEPRQRTLRATVDWSHDLLSAAEKALFGRLSVFAGPASLEAVEAVCLGGSVGPGAVLDLVSRLSEKSLLVVEERGGEARYRMLQTVRQYARERLHDSGEEETLLDRHAAYFLSLAEEAEPRLRGKDREAWLGFLDAAQADLRAAFGRSEAEGDTRTALALVGALPWFWYFRGHLDEWRETCEKALGMASGAPGLAPVRAKALWSLGAASWVGGDYPASRRSLAEAVGTWRGLRRQGACDEADVEGGPAYPLALLGLVEGLLGDFEAAKGLDEESVRLFRRIGDRWGLALALYWLGESFRIGREHARACERYEESRTLFSEVGDGWGLALALQGLGAVAYREGDHGEARAYLEEALLMRRRASDSWLSAQTLSTLGAAELALGDTQSATGRFRESLTLYRELGDPLGTEAALRYLGEAALAAGDPERAKGAFREAAGISSDLDLVRRTAASLEGLARAHLALGSPREAALLLGAVGSRERTDEVRPAAKRDRGRLERAVASGLGREGFEVALAEGRAMTPADAVAAAGHPSGAKAGEEEAPAAAYPAGLTAREAEVIGLISRGLSDARVAEELYLSTRTVNAHARSIYRKLGVGSRAQAIRFALDNGLG